MTFTTNRFDSHFRKYPSGFMHKQQIFNHQVEFCRMDAVLVIMEVMAEQGAYLLHARLGSVSVPLPHACIECMADDAYGRGNHAPHIVAGINLNFLLGQDNGYLRMVSTYYAQCFGPTDVLGYDITCFFSRILRYGLSIIKTINTSVICHSSICRLSLNIHLPIIIHLPAFTTHLPACLHPLLEKLGHPYRKAENGYENR